MKKIICLLMITAILFAVCIPVTAENTTETTKFDPGMSEYIRVSYTASVYTVLRVKDSKNKVVVTAGVGLCDGVDGSNFVFDVLSCSLASYSAQFLMPNQGYVLEMISTEGKKSTVVRVHVSTLSCECENRSEASYPSKSNDSGNIIYTFDMGEKVTDENVGKLVDDMDVYVDDYYTNWILDGVDQLELNETAKINTIGPDADKAKSDIKWSSNDSTVVTVSNDGTIKAVGYGEATINADILYAHRQMIITVNCYPEKISIKDITLMTYAMTDIEPIFTPTNTNVTDVTYMVEDESIVEESEGQLHTLEKTGKTTVHAKTSNGLECSFTVTVLPSHYEGVDDLIFTPDKYNVKPGDEFTAYAKYVYEDGYDESASKGLGMKWTTDDDTIVKVVKSEYGKCTFKAVKEGEIYINVESEKGYYINYALVTVSKSNNDKKAVKSTDNNYLIPIIIGAGVILLVGLTIVFIIVKKKKKACASVIDDDKNEDK